MTYAKSDTDWQRLVCERAGRRCVWPGCGSSWNAAGHHVFDRRYSELRLVLENGVCLCGVHHTTIGTAPIRKRAAMSKLLVGVNLYEELSSLKSGSNHADHIEVPPSSGDVGRFW